jgi:hypothetical protein
MRDFRNRHSIALVARFCFSNDLEISQMNMHADFTTTSAPQATHLQSLNPVERLPFTVKVVTNSEQLDKAVSIRHLAYARHVPEFAEKLAVPEASDFDPGAIVLVAESKLDGSALGTMRIQTNRYGQLKLEESVDLPDWLEGQSLAEATRLGISEGREGRLVKVVLFKAYFLYCMHAKIDWMVITARKPLDRQYEALQFRDVFPNHGLLPMRHVGNLPHRVMAFNVQTAEQCWIASHHPLYDFMCNVFHPDIQLSTALTGGEMPMTDLLTDSRKADGSMQISL